MAPGTVEVMPPPFDTSAEPPADPDDWTDEQWLAWLEATDPEEEVPPRPLTWRSNQTGSMLGAAMLGLRDAIYGHPDDEVAIVQTVSDDPPDDDGYDLRLDPDHPEQSEIIVRRRGGIPRSSEGADEGSASDEAGTDHAGGRGQEGDAPPPSDPEA
jgi:hypothetical protein